MNYILSDTNECDIPDLNMCDTNADCINTIGDYSCVCLTGYSGNGFQCSGTSIKILLS